MFKKYTFWQNVYAYAGVLIALLMGFGFSSGTEIIQYFSAYHWAGLSGVVIAFFVIIYSFNELLIITHQQKFQSGGEIFHYLCGPIVGRLFDGVIIVFMFLAYIVMLSGTAAVMQQYGWQAWFGVGVMGMATYVTVTQYSQWIVPIMARCGWWLFLAVLLFAIDIVCNQPLSLTVLENQDNDELATVSKHSVLAAATYAGFIMTWLFSLMSALNTSVSGLKVVQWGGNLGIWVYSLALLVMAFALMVNLDAVSQEAVVTLALLNHHDPIWSLFWVLVMMVCVYTTALPHLWYVAKRLTQLSPTKQTFDFKKTAFILALIGMVVGISVPQHWLVYWVYGINGYVGMVLLFCLFAHRLKRLLMTLLSSFSIKK